MGFFVIVSAPKHKETVKQKKLLEPEPEKEMSRQFVDYRNIVKEAEQSKKEKIAKKQKPKTRPNDADFVDDSGIPPLETVQR